MTIIDIIFLHFSEIYHYLCYLVMINKFIEIIMDNMKLIEFHTNKIIATTNLVKYSVTYRY